MKRAALFSNLYCRLAASGGMLEGLHALFKFPRGRTHHVEDALCYVGGIAFVHDTTFRGCTHGTTLGEKHALKCRPAAPGEVLEGNPERVFYEVEGLTLMQVRHLGVQSLKLCRIVAHDLS
eukprot:1160191-Pelagomonas_calceolata.AAC.5